MDDDTLFSQYCEKYEQDLLKITTSGSFGPFGAKEQDLNRQLFSLVSDLVPFRSFDIHVVNEADMLYRYLCAFSWTPSTAAQALRNYRAWRIEQKMNNVLFEPQSALISGASSLYRGGRTKKGVAFCIMKPDPQVVAQIIEQYSEDAIVRRQFYTNELGRRVMLANGVDRFHMILDLSLAGLSSIRYRGVVGCLKKLTQESQLRYAEIMDKVLICHGGYVFSTGYAIIKHFIEERVRNDVIDAGNSVESIREALDKLGCDFSTMPQEYGGELAQMPGSSSEVYQCMKEISDGAVSIATPPLNPAGFRGDFPPPPAAAPAPAAASKPSAAAAVAENNDGEPTPQIARHASLESCESGDLQEADIVISSPHGSPSTSKARRGFDDDDDADDEEEAAAAADVGGGVQIHMNLRRDSSTTADSPAAADPLAAVTAASPPASPASPMTKSLMRLPPRCVHLFVRLKNHSAFPDPRITARTEVMKRGQAATAPLVRGHAEIAATLEKTGAFFVIGSKVMAVPESSNSGQPSPAPSCVAEFVGESSQHVRRHLLVIDAQRRVHFLLQRAAASNQIVVMRPATGILPEVDQDRCSFRGPADRVVLARVRPDGLNCGGWIALRDEEAAAAAAEAGAGTAAGEGSLARCVEFPVSAANSEVASSLFMVPRTHKFERGHSERRNGAHKAFQRHISFEQDFLSAPVPVLAALVVAIDSMLS